ncbi:nuclear pore complex protein Nup133-like [Ruditapes philippinarum]|uniref:nuclear pore complex protein Nup133-like n=1 Tax=Ruditapes philippinarum TaxID=129788 RepID=UPI00295AF7DA|nr:nuclear pore complex protein Nup133-like [Ruditapes philippinarum]
MSTKLLLCQHAEQLQAACILREMHSTYSDVIDPAIRKVLTTRGEQMGTGLSPQDLFYREVSHVQDLFEALLEYESDIMAGNFTPADIINIIASVNSILEGMLHAAIDYRQSKALSYGTGMELTRTPEFMPWTSTSGTSGVRTLIHKQFMLTLDSAIPEVRDLETREQLFQHMIALADNILDGYNSQIASICNNEDMVEYTMQVEEQYRQERHNLIGPFLEHKQYERAGSLAEKYCDFEMLIRICEETGNQERIQRYQQQFADKGFSDFLFSWYMKEGKQGRLLSLPTPQQTQLNSFLQKDEFGYLKWLHDIECKDFLSAHNTLLNLGRNEEEYLAKKKTLLSLAKLAALAHGDADEQLKTNISDIDDEQELILNQELLPTELLQTMNVDADHMKVLTPLELLQLYICDENTSATEYDFKKALDLLQFLNQDDPAIDYETIRISIWCKAILRDKAIWTHTATGDPIDSIRDTIFFKTIELAVTDGCEPSSLLPDFQSMLTCDTLSPVSTDKQLQFLLGAVYEMANNYT